jgi:hypothetical protein
MADDDDDNDSKTITNLDDARILKRVGAPLNMRVEHLNFSEAYSRHWFALMNAQAKFQSAMFRFLLDDEKRPAKWWSARRRFIALEMEVDRTVEFWAVELGGNQPYEAAPAFKSEQDAREYHLLHYFISERVWPYLDFWRDAIDEAEAGNVPTFKLSDIPPWVDDELCG